MQSVTLVQTKWADIKSGDTIFWNGGRETVEEAADTKQGHRRVTVNGQTHTMSRGASVVVVQPHY